MSELFATESLLNDDGPGLWGDSLPQAQNTVGGAVAYRVLARKYRPSTFTQLIGQEAMVKTLTNAIEAGRLPQAWMLTGVRGIGKTTTARIIARALNCTGIDGKSGPTILPCGVCDACRAIAEDRHVDVQEMDAASRTSVDDIRDIIDGVRYGPVSARYKIYILDEVHMLSKNAFNALLKTLEEPPPHTKFIFATTEIRKVPVTVLSRCQRFDLRRIESGVLTKHFAQVAAMEQVAAEEEAIKLIAHAADGSVRDGLSLLDQAIARGNGAITEAEVKDMLGLADRGQSLMLCRQLMLGEVKAALDSFASMQMAGTDPLQILQDMAELVHLLTRAQIVTDLTQAPDMPEAEKHMVTDLSAIKIPALTRAWQILLKGIGEVQSAPHPAQAAEMVLIRVAYAAELPPPSDLIKQLREQISSGGNAGKSGPPSGGSNAPRAILSGNGGAQAVAAQAPVALAQADLPQPTSFTEVVALFAQNREGPVQAQLYNAVHLVRFEPGLLEIRIEDGAMPNLASKIGQCLTQWTGRRWMVSLTDKPGEPTLQEVEKNAEKQRQERAQAHPLMQAVMSAFPGTKLVALRQKSIAPVVTPRDDDKDDINLNEITLNPTEFEELP